MNIHVGSARKKIRGGWRLRVVGDNTVPLNLCTPSGLYLEILVWGESTCKLSCRILTIQYYYAIAYILICNLQSNFLFLNFV